MRDGLKALPSSFDIAYVTSCDLPLLGDREIAVMEVDGFPHPLSAVHRRDTLPQVEALMAKDRLRPVLLFDAVRTAECCLRRWPRSIRNSTRCGT